MDGFSFIPHQAVLFLDEIQECAGARTFLKNAVLDGWLDVIASGSLLGLKGYNKKKSEGAAVGFTKRLTMHPLDFEEYLWAKGVKEGVISLIKNRFREHKPLPEAMHEKLSALFREYIVIGGTPSIVDGFIRDKNFRTAIEAQRSLIEDYKTDFGKYLDKNEEERVDPNLLIALSEVFSSMPAQLAKENKKFQYSTIGGKARGSTRLQAVNWLVDYGLLLPCHRLKKLEKPLEGNKDVDCYKLYFADTGLLVASLGDSAPRDILEGNLSIYKGAIYENVVACVFANNEIPLYYYESSGTIEIDFVAEYEREVSLVEVKPRGGKAKAAKYILDRPDESHVPYCVKFTSTQPSFVGPNINYPHYMSFLFGSKNPLDGLEAVEI